MDYLKGNARQPESHLVEWLLAAFIQISHGRDYIEGMALPIKLGEIKAWLSLFPTTQIAEFISFIQSMDKAFLRFVNEKIDDNPSEASMDWLFDILTEVKNGHS